MIVSINLPTRRQIAVHDARQELLVLYSIYAPLSRPQALCYLTFLVPRSASAALDTLRNVRKRMDMERGQIQGLTNSLNEFFVESHALAYIM